MIRRILSLVVALIVLAGVLAGVLVFTTPKPARSAPGWTRLADMPIPRGEVGSAVFTQRNGSPSLIVAGGIKGFGKTVAEVNLYEAIGDRWSRGPDLPDVRHHPAAAVLRAEVFVSGGARRATRWTPERNLWVLRSGRWQTLSPMPEARMAHQMVTLGGRLYVIGGRGGSARVEIYDVASNRWTFGAPLPQKRDHLAAVASRGRIYAIGGRDTDITTRVDVYDPVKDSWSEGPPLPRPMSAMGAGLLDDGIHVVGGEDPRALGGGVIEAHYVLNLSSRIWSRGPDPFLWVHGAASGVLGGRLILAGGARRQGTLSFLGWTGLTQLLG
jgi:N-acetylneuraminic acid mutarotase